MRNFFLLPSSLVPMLCRALSHNVALLCFPLLSCASAQLGEALKTHCFIGSNPSLLPSLRRGLEVYVVAVPLQPHGENGDLNMAQDY